MTHTTPPWGRYQELRPDQLAAIVDARPVALWPLGLIEGRFVSQIPVGAAREPPKGAKS